MSWTKYKCLVNKFSIISEGQEFLINGSSAKDMDGNTLDIETKFIERHSNPDSGDDYNFELIGEEKAIEKSDEVDGTSDAVQLERKKQGRFIALCDYDVAECYNTLEEAKKQAETASRCALVAEVRNALVIETTKKWEA